MKCHDLWKITNLFLIFTISELNIRNILLPTKYITGSLPILLIIEIYSCFIQDVAIQKMFNTFKNKTKLSRLTSGI